MLGYGAHSRMHTAKILRLSEDLPVVVEIVDKAEKIAAFLPEIAHSDNMGRISGYGWSLGYFGGLLTLGICLAYIPWASGQGQGAAEYVPVTLLITAAIFALAAVPTFVWLREQALPGGKHECWMIKCKKIPIFW